METLHQILRENLDGLSSFGREASGGVSRLLYDENWVKAQMHLKDTFEKAGLAAYFDEVGNLFGRLEGENPNETILSGSHVDTVVQGGTLDGQLGIIAGFVAIDYLNKTYGKPKRNLEVVAIAEEEGSRFSCTYWGSRNIVGTVTEEEIGNIADGEGIPFVKAMKEAGFGFKESTTRTDFKGFVELHIEQGIVLEREQKALGVVTAIAGQYRYTVKLSGEANHAGTTPMSLRKDAVHCFSKICYEATEKAKVAGDPLVVTFGRVVPEPNVVNVVAGDLLFTIDCRHTDEEELKVFTEEMEADMERTAAEMGLAIDIDPWMKVPPVPMDDGLVAMIEAQCKEAGLNYKMMPSGAGHDAQVLAKAMPCAMIFVPSIAGISHNPAEVTHLDDLVEGTKALIAALYELAYQ